MPRWISRSADERGVRRSVAWAFVAVPLIGLAAVVALRAAHLPTFRVVMEEDGVVEWLQFACFLASGIVAGAIAARRWRADHRWQGALFGLAAVSLLFVAGEEIAWGQRLLELRTPEWLEDINLQDEITVHNISGVLFGFNLVLLVTSLYGIIAEPLHWGSGFANRWNAGRTLLVPPFFLASAFLVMASMRVYRLVAGTPSQYTITKLIEWAELCYAAAVLCFLWLALRELRRDQSGVDGETPTG